MSFLEMLKFVLMIIESGALLGTLIYGTKGFKERQNMDTRRSLLIQGMIYFGVFLVLTTIRYLYFE